MICIVGYDLNAEAGIPHYSDVLNGVWSRPESRLNPFDSDMNYRQVMQWFACRRNLIKRNANFPAYRVLGDLKKRLNFPIATQCIDGLAGLNGVQLEMEIFGNVFQSKCYSCGHEDVSGLTSNCSGCGGRLFPNVTMFNWNVREKTRDALISQLANVELALLIGVDERLFPFSSGYPWAHHGLKALRFDEGIIRLQAEHEKLLRGVDLAVYLKTCGVKSELIDRVAKVKTYEEIGIQELLALVSYLIQQKLGNE